MREDTSVNGMADPYPTEFHCAGCRYTVNEARRLQCACYYCRECLTRFLHFKMEDRMEWPPQCCGISLSEKDVIWLNSEDLLNKYLGVDQEVKMTNPLYCCRPQCSALLGYGEAVDGSGTMTCDECGTKTCKKCKQAAHEAPKTKCKGPVLDPVLKEMAKKNRWKICPHCSRIVSRNDGCFHIKCQCGGQFCYICGLAWKTCSCIVPPPRLTDEQVQENYRKFGIVDNVENGERPWLRGAFARTQENTPPVQQAQPTHSHPLPPVIHHLNHLPPGPGDSTRRLNQLPPLDTQYLPQDRYPVENPMLTMRPSAMEMGVSNSDQLLNPLNGQWSNYMRLPPSLRFPQGGVSPLLPHASLGVNNGIIPRSSPALPVPPDDEESLERERVASARMEARSRRRWAKVARLVKRLELQNEGPRSPLSSSSSSRIPSPKKPSPKKSASKAPRKPRKPKNP
ncbi:hypothetical protein F4781DRAFT_404783 [Annulohypoxylon bovei var. microspora]|nr:hypothetical protein F4781DRAFT_404783 [Annulohypoxylon bovei var. microspora]